jgi:hypothetical protein
MEGDMPERLASSIARRGRALVAGMRVPVLARRSRARPADARRYNYLLAAVVVPPVLFMLALALWQQPLRGDLTRPGGYAEDRYGWNEPQERFVPPLASTEYDRPYDIVVFGDSFSSNPTGQTNPGAYWTNYLAQRTGMSLVTLSRWNMTLSDLLRHPVFVASPPRQLILESVERYLVRDFIIEVDRRMGRFGSDCSPADQDLPPLPEFRPVSAVPVPWTRDTRPEVDFDQAANFAWKAVRRNFFNVDTTRVVRLGLVRADLLSSQASDQLLVYDDDILKVNHAGPGSVDAIYCTMIAIQNRIQGNGRTRFLFMAAPDKVTAYADYLDDPELRHISLLPELYRRPGLNQVRLVERFRRAMRCGMKDIYLPNDTHWGSAGHRIVAEAVADALAGLTNVPPCGCRECSQMSAETDG